MRCGVGGRKSGLDDESVAALKAIGTNALPVLLKMVNTTDGGLKSKLKNLANSQRLIKVRIAAAAELRELGETGFLLLGAEAKPAIPELLKLTEHHDAVVRGTALYCLSVVQASNELFLPVVQRALHDANHGVQLEADSKCSSLLPYEQNEIHLASGRCRGGNVGGSVCPGGGGVAERRALVESEEVDRVVGGAARDLLV